MSQPNGKSLSEIIRMPERKITDDNKLCFKFSDYTYKTNITNGNEILLCIIFIYT